MSVTIQGFGVWNHKTQQCMAAEDSEALIEQFTPVSCLPICSPIAPHNIIQVNCENPNVTQSPKAPKTPRSVDDIESLEGTCPKAPTNLNLLPETVPEMKEFLKSIDERGEIIWAKPNDFSSIKDLLQIWIDSIKKNAAVAVGYNHEIEAQLAFVNQLIDIGPDSEKLKGITHLSLEMFGADGHRSVNPKQDLSVWDAGNTETKKSFYGKDMQSFLDYYSQTHDILALRFFGDYIKHVASFKNRDCNKHYLSTLSIAANSGYRLIAGDMSIAENLALEFMTHNNNYRFDVREHFAAHYAQGFLESGRKNIVLYLWGQQHVEKHGFSRWIACESPETKVLSVVLNGGAYDRKNIFDQALQDLGEEDPKWNENPFAILLHKYREGDVVIHLPTNGNVVEYSGIREQAPLIILR